MTILRECRHCKRAPINVRVTIPADLSYTHRERLADKGIDFCIASIVKALEDGGVFMRGSCCGHGGGIGDIHL
jgi:hypothetical protein